MTVLKKIYVCADKSFFVFRLLNNYVGFDPKDLTCCWDFVKCAAEVQNRKPLDETKLNSYHVGFIPLNLLILVLLC